MPTSRSEGRRTTRPRTSAARSSSGPAIRQPGTSSRWAESAAGRTRCGAASPMEATGPATAIAEPASNTAAMPPGHAGPGRRHAEPLRRIIDQREGVACGRDGDGEDRADDEGGKDRPERVEGAPGQRTGRPEAGLVQRTFAGRRHGQGPGKQHHLERHAAEREPYRNEVPRAPGQGLGEHPGRSGAQEGQPQVFDGACQMRGVDGYDDREPGARVDTERDDGAREAESGDHDRVPSMGFAEERFGEGGERYRARSQGLAGRGAHGQRADSGEEQRDPPRGEAVWRDGPSDLGHEVRV